MKLIYLFLFSLFSLFFLNPANAQSKWTEEELNRANTAKNAGYLSTEEKNIIFYMNLVRMDGDRFFKTYFQDFVQSHNLKMQAFRNYEDLKVDRQDKYYRGLEIDLKLIKGLPMFYPDELLTYGADQHGIEMNRYNLAGHGSKDGRNAQDRIGKYYPNRSLAENLAFGFAKGLDNVCLLLLDKGVADLGHRKNILNNTLGLNIVGVSIQRHPTYRYSATIDFAGIPNLKI